MANSDASKLPDVAAILGGVLERVPREHQPLLVAIAERMAAERYRGWAVDPANQAHKSQLLACAEREEEIASRIESLYEEAAAVQRDILARIPDLEEINHNLFAGRPLAQQFAIQAQGERLGAATWRAFSREDSRSPRPVFLACAELEEANAVAVEAILEAGS